MDTARMKPRRDGALNAVSASGSGVYRQHHACRSRRGHHRTQPIQLALCSLLEGGGRALLLHERRVLKGHMQLTIEMLDDLFRGALPGDVSL